MNVENFETDFERGLVNAMQTFFLKQTVMDACFILDRQPIKESLQWGA
jgi:hypothetical protein